MFRAFDDFLGDDAVFDDFLSVVNVVEKKIERGDPLDEPIFDVFPFLPWNNPWNGVEGKDAFGALVVAVNREGDPLIEKCL